MKFDFSKPAAVFFLLSCLSPAFADIPGQSIDSLIEKVEYTQAVEIATLKSDHYLAELIGKSREAQLSKSKMWLALVHYKEGTFGGMVSMVDGADFFLAKDGQSNPQAELEATLASFFSSRNIAPTIHTSQCKFVARYRWLKSVLKFDATRLPEQTCKDFDLYYKLLAPESLTVVFPTTHPGSPSSMFGHTLLRVNKKGWKEKTRMLNYSLNFAAQVPPEVSAFSYTALGLAGGFQGRFSVLPYYSKLREYAQMENRDIWEYNLNLDEAQTSLVVQHVYELAPTYFDYFFFTENCSYHLLSLLDVVFPDRPLTEEFKSWTIPVDTLKVLEERGLISEAKYYPSSARIIEERRKSMSAADGMLALNSLNMQWPEVEKTIDDLPPQRQVAVLDLINDYYRYNKLKQLEKSDGSLNSSEKRILARRAKIPLPSKALVVPPPTIRADYGHGTTRAGIGEIYRDDTFYSELDWRAAYHDLLDSSDGYVANSALEFVDIRARYNHQTQEAYLDSLTAIDIISLEPRDIFFNNLSWRVNTGWRREYMNKRYDYGMAYLDSGVGLSYRLLKNSDSTLLYGLAEAEIMAGKLENSIYKFALGYQLGIVTEPVKNWRLLVSLKYRAGLLGVSSQDYVSSIGQSLKLSRNVNFQLHAEQLGFGEFNPTLKTGLYFYF